MTRTSVFRPNDRPGGTSEQVLHYERTHAHTEGHSTRGVARIEKLLQRQLRRAFASLRSNCFALQSQINVMSSPESHRQLRIGDTVYLLYQQPTDGVRFLSTGNGARSAAFAAPTQEASRDFRGCLFRVDVPREYHYALSSLSSKGSKSQLERHRKREQLCNWSEARAYAGTGLIYGQHVQLFHLQSGAYLNVDFGRLAPTESIGSDGALEVRFDPQGSFGSWLRILPYSQSRREGQAVQYGDEVVLMAGSEETLTMSLGFNRSSGRIRALDRESPWRFMCFNPHTLDERFVRVSTPIQLLNVEKRGGLLCCNWVHSFALRDDSGLSSGHEVAEYKLTIEQAREGQIKSNGIWELLDERFYAGGTLVCHTDTCAEEQSIPKYRIRHVATGCFLAYSKLAASFVVVQHLGDSKVGDVHTLFDLHSNEESPSFDSFVTFRISKHCSDDCARPWIGLQHDSDHNSPSTIAAVHGTTDHDKFRFVRVDATTEYLVARLSGCARVLRQLLEVGRNIKEEGTSLDNQLVTESVDVLHEALKILHETEKDHGAQAALREQEVLALLPRCLDMLRFIENSTPLDLSELQRTLLALLHQGANGNAANCAYLEPFAPVLITLEPEILFAGKAWKALRSLLRETPFLAARFLDSQDCQLAVLNLFSVLNERAADASDAIRRRERIPRLLAALCEAKEGPLGDGKIGILRNQVFLLAHFKPPLAFERLDDTKGGYRVRFGTEKTLPAVPLLTLFQSADHQRFMAAVLRLYGALVAGQHHDAASHLMASAGLDLHVVLTCLRSLPDRTSRTSCKLQAQLLRLVRLLHTSSLPNALDGFRLWFWDQDVSLNPNAPLRTVALGRVDRYASLMDNFIDHAMSYWSDLAKFKMLPAIWSSCLPSGPAKCSTDEMLRAMLEHARLTIDLLHTGLVESHLGENDLISFARSLSEVLQIMQSRVPVDDENAPSVHKHQKQLDLHAACLVRVLEMFAHLAKRQVRADQLHVRAIMHTSRVVESDSHDDLAKEILGDIAVSRREKKQGSNTLTSEMQRLILYNSPVRLAQVLLQFAMTHESHLVKEIAFKVLLLVCDRPLQVCKKLNQTLVISGAAAENHFEVMLTMGSELRKRTVPAQEKEAAALIIRMVQLGIDQRRLGKQPLEVVQDIWRHLHIHDTVLDMLKSWMYNFRPDGIGKGAWAALPDSTSTLQHVGSSKSHDETAESFPKACIKFLIRFSSLHHRNQKELREHSKLFNDIARLGVCDVGKLQSHLLSTAGLEEVFPFIDFTIAEMMKDFNPRHVKHLKTLIRAREGSGVQSYILKRLLQDRKMLLLLFEGADNHDIRTEYMNHLRHIDDPELEKILEYHCQIVKLLAALCSDQGYCLLCVRDLVPLSEIESALFSPGVFPQICRSYLSVLLHAYMMLLKSNEKSEKALRKNLLDVLANLLPVLIQELRDFAASLQDPESVGQPGTAFNVLDHRNRNRAKYVHHTVLPLLYHIPLDLFKPELVQHLIGALETFAKADFLPEFVCRAASQLLMKVSNISDKGGGVQAKPILSLPLPPAHLEQDESKLPLLLSVPTAPVHSTVPSETSKIASVRRRPSETLAPGCPLPPPPEDPPALLLMPPPDQSETNRARQQKKLYKVIAEMRQALSIETGGYAKVFTEAVAQMLDLHQLDVRRMHHGWTRRSFQTAMLRLLQSVVPSASERAFSSLGNKQAKIYRPDSSEWRKAYNKSLKVQRRRQKMLVRLGLAELCLGLLHQKEKLKVQLSVLELLISLLDNANKDVQDAIHRMLSGTKLGDQFFAYAFWTLGKEIKPNAGGQQLHTDGEETKGTQLEEEAEEKGLAATDVEALHHAKSQIQKSEMKQQRYAAAVLLRLLRLLQALCDGCHLPFQDLHREQVGARASVNIVSTVASVVVALENRIHTCFTAQPTAKPLVIAQAIQALRTLSDFCQGDSVSNQSVLARRRRLILNINEVLAYETDDDAPLAVMLLDLQAEMLNFVMSLLEIHPPDVMSVILEDLDTNVLACAMTSARARLSEKDLALAEEPAVRDLFSDMFYTVYHITQGLPPSASEVVLPVSVSNMISRHRARFCFNAFHVLCSLQDYVLSDPERSIKYSSAICTDFAEQFVLKPGGSKIRKWAELHIKHTSDKAKHLALRQTKDEDVHSPRSPTPSQQYVSIEVSDQSQSQSFDDGQVESDRSRSGPKGLYPGFDGTVWSFPRALASVATHVGAVEVVRNNIIEVVYFRMPAVAQNLSARSIAKMKDEVSHTSAKEKLHDFVRLTGRVERESIFQQKVRNGPWLISWAAGRWEVAAKLAYLLAVIMNIVMGVFYERIEESTWSDSILGTGRNAWISETPWQKNGNSSQWIALTNTQVVDVPSSWLSLSIDLFGIIQIVSAAMITMTYALEFGLMSALDKIGKLTFTKTTRAIGSAGEYAEFAASAETSVLARTQEVWWRDLSRLGISDQDGETMTKNFLLSSSPLKLAGWYIYYLFGDPTQLYYLCYLGISLLGYLHRPWWYALLLFDMFFRSHTLNTVLLGLRRSFRQLLLVFTLILCVVYVFAWVSFVNFPKFYSAEEGDDTPMYCQTLLECFSSTVHWGLLLSGGIGEAAAPAEDGDGSYWFRFAFDVSFFFIVVAVLLNIILGIIIDAFAKLRKEADVRKQRLDRTCFISNLDLNVFDQGRSPHNLQSYIGFIIYLRNRPYGYCSGIERSIKVQLEGNSVAWFPIGRARCLVQEGGVRASAHNT